MEGIKKNRVIGGKNAKQIYFNLDTKEQNSTVDGEIISNSYVIIVRAIPSNMLYYSEKPEHV